MAWQWSEVFSTSNQYIKYQIAVEERDVNTANNTSSWATKVLFWRTNTGYETWGQGTAYMRLRSSTGEVSPWYSYGVGYNQHITNEGIYLVDDTWGPRLHNADGSYWVEFDFYFRHSAVNSNASESDPATFRQYGTTIPRASAMTIEGPTPKQLGEDVNVTIAPATTGVNHKIYMRVGQGEWELNATLAVGATARSVRIPYTVANSFPNNREGTVYLKLVTYLGSAELGSREYPLSVRMTSSGTSFLLEPDIGEPTVEDLAGYFPQYNKYVEGKSKLHVQIPVTTKYGATVLNVKTTVYGNGIASGQVYNGTDFETMELPPLAGGTYALWIQVTDSRGYGSSKMVTLPAVQYTPPQVTISRLDRCDSTGNIAAGKEYCKVTMSGAIVDLPGNTNWSYSLKYKREDGTGAQATASVSFTRTFTNLTAVIPADSGHAWTITLSATDPFTTVATEKVLLSLETLIHFPAHGKGLSLGRMDDVRGLNVHMPPRFYGDTGGFNVGGSPLMIQNSRDEMHGSAYSHTYPFLQFFGEGTDMSKTGDENQSIASVGLSYPSKNALRIRYGDSYLDLSENDIRYQMATPSGVSGASLLSDIVATGESTLTSMIHERWVKYRNGRFEIWYWFYPNTPLDLNWVLYFSPPFPVSTIYCALAGPGDWLTENAYLAVPTNGDSWRLAVRPVPSATPSGRSEVWGYVVGLYS